MGWLRARWIARSFGRPTSNEGLRPNRRQPGSPGRRASACTGQWIKPLHAPWVSPKCGPCWKITTAVNCPWPWSLASGPDTDRTTHVPVIAMVGAVGVTPLKTPVRPNVMVDPLFVVMTTCPW